jgi:hypothetical protein
MHRDRVADHGTFDVERAGLRISQTVLRGILATTARPKNPPCCSRSTRSD